MTKKEMITKALEYTKAYYEGHPIISDAEFDKFKKQLNDMGITDAELKVGNDVGDKSKYTIKHSYPMGSLEKVHADWYGDETHIDFNGFANEINKRFASKSDSDIFEWTPKLDGNSFSIECTREDNEHFKIEVSTRGDDGMGCNITPQWMVHYKNTKYFDKLSDAVRALCHNVGDVLCIRGEVIVNTMDFVKSFNSFCNPRSFVAGILNQMWEDTEEQNFYAKHLHWVCYEYRVVSALTKRYVELDYLNEKEPTHALIKPYLGHIGELIDSNASFVTSGVDADMLERMFNFYDEYRKEYSAYPLDGIVLKPTVSGRAYNSNRVCPIDCCAIKFLPAIDYSEIVDVEWSNMKSATYNPIARLKPFYMDGKKIDKASLYNYNKMVSNNIGIGSKVRVTLSGDIIPMILEVINEDGKEYTFPIPQDAEIFSTYEKGTEVKHIHKKYASAEELNKHQFAMSAVVLGVPGIGQKVAESIWDMVFCSKNVSLKNLLELLSYSNEELIDILGDSKSSINYINALTLFRSKLDMPMLIESLCLPSCGKALSLEAAQIMSGLADASNKKFIKWASDKDSDEYMRVVSLMDIAKVDFLVANENDSNANDITPIIMHGEPKKCCGYKTKKEWLAAHPQYRETTKRSEYKILFSDELPEDGKKMSNKIKNALADGVEIKLFYD